MCAKGHFYRRPRGKRCPICERARNKERYRSDPDRRALSTRQWQKVRKLAAERDGHRCRFEGDDCYGRLEAHHIVAIKLGGAPYDLENIAIICKRHHFLLERETRTGAEKGSSERRFPNPTDCRRNAGAVGESRTRAGAPPAAPSGRRPHSRNERSAGPGSLRSRVLPSRCFFETCPNPLPVLFRRERFFRKGVPEPIAVFREGHSREKTRARKPRDRLTRLYYRADRFILAVCVSLRCRHREPGRRSGCGRGSRRRSRLPRPWRGPRCD